MTHNNHPPERSPVRVSAALLFACACVWGCGETGSQGYDVSGTVHYKGQRVPAGEIIFEPDESQGGRGPTGLAVIKDGRYHTLPERRPAAGPHIVYISGFDGVPHEEEPDEFPYGAGVLFSNYKTAIDLPERDSTHEFEVPNRE